MMRKLRWACQAKRNEAGQSIIEMAIVATFLLSLVAGIVDLGGAFHHYIVITNAAREGARQGARIPCVGAQLTTFTNSVTQAAINEAANSGVVLTAANITIAPSSCPTAGSQLVVTVTINYDPLLGAFLGFGTFPISNAVRMVFAGNDQG